MREQALFFAAMADETRLRLLSLMQDGEICVCHFQSVLQTNQPKISRHLAYLRKAGLVATRREGKWTHYRLRTIDVARQKILANVLVGLADEPAIKRDRQRLDKITCCPGRYGISLPKPTT